MFKANKRIKTYGQISLSILLALLLGGCDGDDSSPTPTPTPTPTSSNAIRVSSVFPLPGRDIYAIPDPGFVVTFDRVPNEPSVNADTVLLEASGGDSTFGDGNETLVASSSISVSAGDSTQVSFDLDGVALADDKYRLRLMASEPSPIIDADANRLDGEFSGEFPSGNGEQGGDFEADYTVLLNAYLGQAAPGEEPRVFAPGVLSFAGKNERVLTFSNDGKEIYFSVALDSGLPSIRYFKQVNGVWQDAKPAPFLSGHSHDAAAEPFMSPDGNTLLFVSVSNNGGVWEIDLWKTVRTGDVWQQPERLSNAINSNIGEWHPCIVANGNIYFSRSGSSTDANIYFSKYLGDHNYADAVPLADINTGSMDWDPYVDPDEKYLIFKSNRPGGEGDFDNYISYRNIDGSWTSPAPLGAINTSRHDEAGDISPDGKYYFFSRYEEDGSIDVYWVDVKALGIFGVL